MLKLSWRSWALVVAAVPFFACNTGTPGQQVAAGAARLTIRNLAAVASIVNKDTTCGFASPSVLANPTLSGEIGSVGSITWTVTDCEFDGGGGYVYSTDCNGVTKTASGKFKISATKTVTGILTGVAASPIVPDGPNAFKAELSSLEFTDFKIEPSDSTSVLTIKSGKATGKLERLLSRLVGSGACGFATDFTKLSDITVTDAEYHIKTDTTETDAKVSEAKLEAYAGKFLDHENEISGSITLSSNTKRGFFRLPPSMSATHTLPERGDTNALDPDYNHDTFLSTFSCDATMEQPLSYECADLTPLLADGAARLTAKMFGTLASLVDKDTTCGFSSAAAGGAAQLVADDTTTGAAAVGKTGTLTLPITACVITLPANTALPADCSGVSTVAGGSVTVTGTKVVAGRLTGDQAAPVVPTSDSPATLTLDITFNDFTVGSSAATSKLRAISGRLQGSLQPRTALADDTGACSISSSVARFNSLGWQNGVLKLTSDSGTFDVAASTSALNAVNGTWDADSNKLTGTITMGGTAHTVPSDGLGLDPAFSQTAFDASWQCTPHLVTPVTYTADTCKFTLPLAQGVSRLTPRTVGTVMSLVNANTDCGFSATTSTNAPAVSLTGTVGQPGGAITQTIAETTPCIIQFPTATDLSADCNGDFNTVTGTVRVYGTKRVEGYRTGDLTTPIVPTTRDPATFDLTMEFDDFLVEADGSTSSLAMADGTLHVVAKPRTALDGATGACSISTPVVAFTDMAYSNAHVMLNSDGKRFGLAIATSDLDAQNGNGDTTNTLTGSITMDGTAYTIPIPGETSALNPDYDQTTFDAGYACTPNLVAVTDPAMCSFQGVLAQGVSRLSARTVGTVTSLVNANTTCGFSAPAVGGTPTWTGAAEGSMPATATFTIPASPGCTLTFATETLVSTDCNGAETRVMGTVKVSGTKTVTGWRTGDPANPVVPSSRDAVTFGLHMEFTDFKVISSASENVLTAHAGAVDATVAPRLAIDGLTGACSIATPVTTFTDITWNAATVTLQAGARSFGATVGSSLLDAQNGNKDTGTTNTLAGTITLNDNAITIPVSADGRLDPDYDQTVFDESYINSTAHPTCNPTMAIPANEAQCSFVGPLAQGISRLSVRNLGAVTSLVDGNTSCGFSSAGVATTPVYSGGTGGTGPVGEIGVTAVFSLPTAGCEIDLSVTPLTTTADCTTASNTISGKVLITGTKTVRGYRTGDLTQPMVPMTRDPATFNLTAVFTDFKVVSSMSTKALTIKTGSATFQVDPRVAMDATTGACKTSTPVVTMTGISYAAGTTVRVEDGAKKFDVAVSASSLDAQAGPKDGVENRLTGSITAMGAPVAIPISADNRLDPDYNATAFAAACTTAIQTSDAACDFRPVLAVGAARLLVRNVGSAVSALNKDTTCGFSSASVVGAGTTTGTSSVTWTLTATDCAVTIPASTPACTPFPAALMEGTVTASGTKAITGAPTGASLPTPPVLPISRNAATFTLTSLAFTDFSARDDLTPATKLLMSGTLTATMRPIAAQSITQSAAAGGTPVYSISTPLAEFQNITGTNIPVTLHNGGHTFQFTINATDVDGYNGTYAGTPAGSNDLGGSITVVGLNVPLTGMDLSPTYDQAQFDGYYACTPDMTATVPFN